MAGPPIQEHTLADHLSPFNACAIDLVVDGVGVLILGLLLAVVLLRPWQQPPEAPRPPVARRPSKAHGHFPPGHWAHEQGPLERQE